MIGLQKNQRSELAEFSGDGSAEQVAQDSIYMWIVVMLLLDEQREVAALQLGQRSELAKFGGNGSAELVCVQRSIHKVQTSERRYRTKKRVTPLQLKQRREPAEFGGNGSAESAALKVSI